jgi:hypothetical protein
VRRLNGSGDPSANLAGRIIKNRYRLDEQIGQTSVCVVYRGFDLLESTPVAVKLLLPGPGGQAEISNPFLAAARRSARLNLPSLVKVYDFGLEEQVAFVVEEPVEGETLQTRFAEGRKMNVRGFLSFAYQVTEVVSQLHAAGSVHGNIRGDNIYVLPASKLKIANAGYPYVDAASGELMVPFPKEANREEDLRALGFLFYRCLSGRELDPVLLEGDLPTPRLDLGEEVPSKVSQILEKSLSRGEKSRFASAQDMLKEIGIALQRDDPMATLPGVAPEEEAPPPQGFFQRLNKTQIIIGSSVLALLLILLIVWLLSSPILKNKTDTPNLVGKNVEEAGKEAESRGLKMVVSKQEFRSDIKADRVVSQSPSAGKRVPQGETISVVVSLGPLQVPNLSGLPVDDAAALIKARGLEVGSITYEATSEYRPGIVLESEPPYGAGISGGEKISLVVSKAP